jgi:Fe-S cluster assembly iron-binding protein IscA
MVQLTQEATKHLVRVRGERGVDAGAGARFVPSGRGVGLTFAPEPKPGDRVVEVKEIPIYLAPEVADKLDKTTIDVSEKDGKVGLVMRPHTGDKPSGS